MYLYEETINELVRSNDLSFDTLKYHFAHIAKELGITGGDEIGNASEAISRIKAIWGLQAKFGDDIESEIIQADQFSKYDFEFRGERYEVKARRDPWTYKRLYTDPSGPYCEADKVPYCDKFITVTSDYFVLCWEVSSSYHRGNPKRKSNTDFGGGEDRRDPVVYYRMSDTVWKSVIEPTAWAIIDDIWEHNKQKNV